MLKEDGSKVNPANSNALIESIRETADEGRLLKPQQSTKKDKFRQLILEAMNNSAHF